jgi:hypothetical protein
MEHLICATNEGDFDIFDGDLLTLTDRVTSPEFEDRWGQDYFVTYTNRLTVIGNPHQPRAWLLITRQELEHELEEDLEYEDEELNGMTHNTLEVLVFAPTEAEARNVVHLLPSFPEIEQGVTERRGEFDYREPAMTFPDDDETGEVGVVEHHHHHPVVDYGTDPVDLVLEYVGLNSGIWAPVPAKFIPKLSRLALNR